MTDPQPDDELRAVLPSGAWARLLAPDALRAKHVRIMSRAVTRFGSDRIGDVVADLNDATMAIIVQEWTCTGSDGAVLPLPSTSLAVIDDMDPYDYIALVNHDCVTQVRDKLVDLRLERVTPDDHDDPESPSVPSSGSAPALRAAPSRPAETSGPAGTTPRTSSGSRTAGSGPRKK